MALRAPLGPYPRYSFQQKKSRDFETIGELKLFCPEKFDNLNYKFPLKNSLTKVDHILQSNFEAKKNHQICIRDLYVFYQAIFKGVLYILEDRRIILILSRKNRNFKFKFPLKSLLEKSIIIHLAH